jgi:hypothetical protein
MLIETANNASLRSRDEIIGANIMREQIELIKNLRDTNWIQFRDWNSTSLSKTSTEAIDIFQTGSYYTIANNFSHDRTISTVKLPGFSLDRNSTTQQFNDVNSAIRLCIDEYGRYVYDCNNTRNQKTHYASFFKVEALETKDMNTNASIVVDRAYKIVVYFISYIKGYKVMSMSTIITDWKNK